jgi:hypothetical protein
MKLIFEFMDFRIDELKIQTRIVLIRKSENPAIRKSSSKPVSWNPKKLIHRNSFTLFPCPARSKRTFFWS